MRITLDIEESTMEEILKATRQTKKSPALAQAVREFLENRKRQQFLEKVLSGGTDYAANNEEVEALARLER